MAERSWELLLYVLICEKKIDFILANLDICSLQRYQKMFNGRNVQTYCMSDGVRISVYFSLSEGSDDEVLYENMPEDITLDETREGTYLSLDEMGVFLSRLASNGIYSPYTCFLWASRFVPSVMNSTVIARI